MGSLHSEADILEQHKQADRYQVQQRKYSPLVPGLELPRDMIGKETFCKDCKIKGRIIMMNVCDPGHSDERQVMEEPTDHRVDARVMYLIDLIWNQYQHDLDM